MFYRRDVYTLTCFEKSWLLPSVGVDRYIAALTKRLTVIKNQRLNVSVNAFDL
jgi:hypothetical protein